MSVYVLQFWGIARFVEVQSMKLGHLVRGTDYFNLVISRSKDGIARVTDVIRIFPMSQSQQKTFCPVIILSNYLKARYELSNTNDNDFLFPKMISSFELGTNRHILA